MKTYRDFRRGRWLLCSLLLVFSLAGCKTQRPKTLAAPNHFEEISQPSTNFIEPVLRSGDTIVVSFSDLPPGIAPITAQLDKDGKINLPHDVTISAVGKTTRQLEQEIKAEYVPKHFKYLTVKITRERGYISVMGEVKQPGLYSWKIDPTILWAIGAAGGTTDWGKLEVQVIRWNGETIRVGLNELLKDPKKDLPLYPGDTVVVLKRALIRW